jgi:hypothetical protein
MSTVLLSEAQAPSVVPPSVDVQEVLQQARETFYKDPNVIGVGIGPRRKNHRVRRDEVALLVYVVQKLPEARVDPAYTIPAEFMGLRTDVVEPFGDDVPRRAADYVADNYVMHDMSNVDWTRLHELAEQGEGPAVRLGDGPVVAHGVKVQDFGDVCVVEDDGTVVKTAADGTQWVDWVRGYQLFRTLHGDDYDFVTFVTDSASGMPPQGGASFWSGIYNNVTGIGLGTFNNRPAWGSARLQGFHFINQGHFSLWRYVMLQEFGHQFAAFARYRDPVTGTTMTDHLLGGVLGHWALDLDDDRSPMGYNLEDWVELPAGRYRRDTLTSDTLVYCNLDLYAMGLLGAGEVGEFNLLRSLVPVPGTTNQFTATPVRLNINHFVAQEGPRSPAASSAPKYWRQAFIVLTKDIHRVHDLVETVDLLRQRWERDFREATKGLGQVDTVLDQRPGRITPAQIAELVGGGTTALHRHRVGAAELQLVNTQFTGSLNAGQTATWFTFNWPTSWFVVWSLRPTTAGGKIRWDVAIERAANNTFTYWLTATNLGPGATSFEGKYAVLQ